MKRTDLDSVVQLLQQDPGAYRSFGPFWWGLKRLLKQTYGPDTLSFLDGDADEPLTTRRLRKLYPRLDDFYAAALHHHGAKVQWGEKYQNHSYMPDDDEVYLLNDPDVGAANMIGT